MCFCLRARTGRHTTKGSPSGGEGRADSAAVQRVAVATWRGWDVAGGSWGGWRKKEKEGWGYDEAEEEDDASVTSEKIYFKGFWMISVLV